VLQLLSLDLDNLNEQKLYDYGYYNLRQQLAPVPGVSSLPRLVGTYRQDSGRYQSNGKIEGQGLDGRNRRREMNAISKCTEPDAAIGAWPKGSATGNYNPFVPRRCLQNLEESHTKNIPVKSGWRTVLLGDGPGPRWPGRCSQNVVRGENGHPALLLASIQENGKCFNARPFRENGVPPSSADRLARRRMRLSINGNYSISRRLVSESGRGSVVREGANRGPLLYRASLILLFIGFMAGSTLISS